MQRPAFVATGVGTVSACVRAWKKQTSKQSEQNEGFSQTKKKASARAASVLLVLSVVSRNKEKGMKE
jgi:hypothetical protein